jgi:hypothetical protein
MSVKRQSFTIATLRGCIVRKERWGVSWAFCLVAASFLFLAVCLLIVNLHSFLAVTHRVDTKILVVEGWTDIYGVTAAVNEFKSGNYDHLLTTGGPVEGMGTSSAIYDTEAWQSAGSLRKAGLPANKVQSVPSVFVGRDRTYNSALALRAWLLTNAPAVDKINVLTEDAHARRTRLLFQEALGPDIQVGIISVPNPDYDATHWWRYSEGVREVIDESIAYLYSKFFFWP